MTDAPVFHVEPQGELGNRMIQYMVALKFRSLVPDARISNVRLPEWNIELPAVGSDGPVETAGQGHHIDLPGLAARVRAGAIRRIVFNGWGQRLENFLTPDFYRAIFRSPAAGPAEFDGRYLICPVRAGDVLNGALFYPLTPVEFYAEIVARTGLVPVFMGQTEPNLYTDRLRAQFPSAAFLASRGPLGDFELIRSAQNIVVGVSTFIWLAAWLSRAEQIFMAVNGLFNPRQYPPADMLPLDDPRYRFYLFPVNYGVPLEHHATAHRRLAPYWRQLTHGDLQLLLRAAPRFNPSIETMLTVLDPNFYLSLYEDAAAMVGRGNPDGARWHYRHHGHRQGRMPLMLDPVWYAVRYPMAAFELAQGDYISFIHHYAAVGRERGYQPMPDPAGPWLPGEETGSG